MGKNLIETMFLKLYACFSYQGWWPVYDINKKRSIYHKGRYKINREDIFEISAGAILTQNTSWKNVEKAIENLKVNNLLDAEKIINLKDEELHILIRSSGYYRQKAERLKIFSKWFYANSEKIYNGFKDENKFNIRNELLSLKGVGRETGDSILLYAFGIKIFVIDSYTRRVYQRFIGDRTEYDYDELREIFEKSIESDYKIYNEFHALIVKLSKEFCFKKSPLCKLCPINGYCHYFKEEYYEKYNRTTGKTSFK